MSVQLDGLNTSVPLTAKVLVPVNIVGRLVSADVPMYMKLGFSFEGPASSVSVIYNHSHVLSKSAIIFMEGPYNTVGEVAFSVVFPLAGTYTVFLHPAYVDQTNFNDVVVDSLPYSVTVANDTTPPPGGVTDGKSFPWIWVIAGIAGAVVVGGTVIYLVKRKKRPKPPSPPMQTSYV
jgi:hypothetical protein